MSLDFWYAVSFPWDYYRGLRAVADSAHRFVRTYAPERKYVVFDFRTTRILFDAGRYLFILAEAFRQAGVEIEVIKNRWFLARAGRKYWGRAALSMPSVEFQRVQCVDRSPVAWLRDYECSGRQVIFGDSSVEGADVFPYPMHPQSYAVPNIGGIRDQRTNRDQPQVFFSGNVKQKYDNPVLANKYGVVSRVKMIAAIRDQFKQRLLSQQKDYSDLEMHFRESSKCSLVINDVNLCPIPRGIWLETLSRFEFFLCCPGVSHPNCHNAIEAMCVGTIPIIEFPELFSPALQDGVNAITFRGLGGLADAVDGALSLSSKQRKRMSQAVIQYYKDHLCIRGFIQRWVGHGATNPMHFPFIPLD